MTRAWDVAVVGATTLVGESLLALLGERKFPARTVHALAEERYAGVEVDTGRKTHLVKDVAEFDFTDVQLVWFVAGSAMARQYAPEAVAAGCIVIDTSAQFRMDEDVPLIIPEVNGTMLSNFRQRNIIACPNSVTVQLLLALKPLHDVARITRIHVTTYQSVSGAGKCGIDELAAQTAQLLNARSIKPKVFPKQIAFNVIPQVDIFQAHGANFGYTKEELQLVQEVRKILAIPELMINPTAVRVPVFFGHSEQVSIETEQPLSAEDARAILQQASGVVVIDDCVDGAYPTAVTEAVNTDEVFVGRIRADLFQANALNLWIVADNIRRGVAVNCLQIAEQLVVDYL